MIDMPVKLAVCFVILGLMVPVVMDVTDDGDDEMSLYQLRSEAFAPEEFPDTEHYLRYVHDNVVRSTGCDFELPDGSTEARAQSLIHHLAELGGLTILEGADGR